MLAMDAQLHQMRPYRRGLCGGLRGSTHSSRRGRLRRARPRDNGITRNRAQTETARPYTTWSNAISSACDRSQTPGLDDLWRKVQKMGCTQIGERMGRGEVGIGSIGLLKVSMDYICYNRVAGSTVNMQALTCRVDVPSARGGAYHW